MIKRFSDDEISKTVEFLTMTRKELLALDEFERCLYPTIHQGHQYKAEEMLPFVWRELQRLKARNKKS